MTYKVRIWAESGVVKCCSSVCTNLESGRICPRVEICQETEIVILEDDYEEEFVEERNEGRDW